MDNVAGWILELDRGEGIPFEGNYSSWLEQKAKRLQQEEKEESKRQKTLQQELEWIRQNPKGRRAKSKARINAYDKLLDQQQEKRREDMEIFIPAGPRLGDKVIVAEHVQKRTMNDCYGGYELFLYLLVELWGLLVRMGQVRPPYSK